MKIEYDRCGRRLCAKEGCPAYKKGWCLACLDYVRELVDLGGDSVRFCKIAGKFVIKEEEKIPKNRRDIIQSLIYMDICHVFMYENPGSSMAAHNLQQAGRLYFNGNPRRGYKDGADLIYYSIIR